MQDSERVKLVCKKRLKKCIHLTYLTTEMKQNETPQNIDSHTPKYRADLTSFSLYESFNACM